jgi:hypothetical protein
MGLAIVFVVDRRLLESSCLIVMIFPCQSTFSLVPFLRSAFEVFATVLAEYTALKLLAQKPRHSPAGHFARAAFFCTSGKRCVEVPARD